MVKRYVAGLLFDYYKERVALVKKSKPEWQRGFWNAIGGKIEDGEHPLTAMNREFEEETGVTGIDWKMTAVLDGKDWQVFFYHAFDDKVDTVVTMEEEEIAVHDWPIDPWGPRVPLIRNVPLIASIALDESGIQKPVYLNDPS